MSALTACLPEVSAAAAPEFSDPLSCKAWLEHVPLANVSEAQRQLLEQLGELNRVALPVLVRLEVLEALREAVAFVQIEQAKRFTNRALPMAPAESTLFATTIDLWEQMRIGYLHCLAAGAAMRPHAALVVQRLLAYSGLKMFHHYRAYRQIPDAEWRGLHQSYRCAEELGVAESEVKDYLNRDVHAVNPRMQYVRALLLGLANPNELTRRQLSFVGFLLERWAEKVTVTSQPVEGEGMPPLVVDIAGDKPPERLVSQTDALPAEARFLDSSNLAHSLKNRIGLLRSGESPAKLALGEDCVQPSCEQMLGFLFRQWCQPRQARALDRKRVSTVALACNDMAAIHYYILGRPFRQPGMQTELSHREREQIATFGRVSTKDEDDYSAVHGFLLEHWQVEDENISGLRMLRSVASPGKRFAHGQLVAVRPGDAKSFMLAQVRWLMQGGEGNLYAGLRMLPGLPSAIAARAYGLNVGKEKFVPALALGEVAALRSPATLILPSGWYKPKRVIELFLQQSVRARLLELTERGADFERMTYTTAVD